MIRFEDQLAYTRGVIHLHAVPALRHKEVYNADNKKDNM